MFNDSNGEFAWLDKTSTDVSVIVEDYTFNAHKVVLSWYSPYLKKIFRHDGSVVKLNGVSPKILQVLFNYMYTKELNLDCQTLPSIFYAARKLKIKGIMEKCIEKLRGNTASSYLYVYTASKELNMDEKKHKSYQMILENFEDCVETAEFLQLNLDEVCDILSGSPIRAQNEAVILRGALRWLDHKDERYSHGIRVLSCIRFHQMNKSEVIDCLHPYFMKKIIVLPILQNILHHILRSITADEIEEGLCGEDEKRQYIRTAK